MYDQGNYSLQGIDGALFYYFNRQFLGDIILGSTCSIRKQMKTVVFRAFYYYNFICCQKE